MAQPQPASLAPTSPIILLDMTTGEREPFFAEIDMNIQPTSPKVANLIIRPLARLKGGDRIAVAVLNTVMDQDGSPLTPSPGFKAILDGKDFNHPRFNALAERYTDIFASLTAARNRSVGPDAPRVGASGRSCRESPASSMGSAECRRWCSGSARRPASIQQPRRSLWNGRPAPTSA